MQKDDLLRLQLSPDGWHFRYFLVLDKGTNQWHDRGYGGSWVDARCLQAAIGRPDLHVIEYTNLHRQICSFYLPMKGHPVYPDCLPDGWPSVVPRSIVGKCGCGVGHVGGIHSDWCPINTPVPDPEVATLGDFDDVPF